MTDFLAELAARRRFGMKPGLDSIRALSAALGNPHLRIRTIHVAGTNGKGAVCATLEACLRATGQTTGRYTSPHLVSLNERFFVNGQPLSDKTLEKHAKNVENALCQWGLTPQNRGLSPEKQAENRGLSPENPGGTLQEVTFFEALTAVGFLAFAEARPDFTILECGLGGRLDATNICNPSLSIITRIGLDHCQWLGNTLEDIAGEKAGIVKPRIPVVLGCNEPNVRAVVEKRAAVIGAPFFYAPDIADESEIPSGFSLAGAFNRENAVTAIAALKVLEQSGQLGRADMRQALGGLSRVVWPGRFQCVDNFIVDGAHNPPAAEALYSTMKECLGDGEKVELIAGFCGDKDAAKVLRTLSPLVRRGFAVHTGNPRSLSAEATAELMQEAGIDASACDSLDAAISAAGRSPALICGSLFLAGAALVKLGAYPWPCGRTDPSELLVADPKADG
ncbi:MAG: bifunctional folylpolyglutamate synthase/dihydrofolate synthase [Kiritimatiellae bacterium]|nr:bifunctional folylpolyglutamate synthase/dihydrofolate synthase [Kiritimatiellia bacterium]